jgi:lysine 2,3-aminomutase
LDLQEGYEENAIGIEKLLSDYDNAISLVPADNERMQRRSDNGQD